jgi:hypothetical protein
MKTRSNFVLVLLACGVAVSGCKKNPGDTKPTAPSATNSPSASTPTSGSGAEPVELKAHWPAGARYIQRTEIAQNADTLIPNMPPMKQSMTMAQDVGIHVLKERDGGGREIEMSIDEMALSVFQGDREIVGFDSKGEAVGADNPVTDAFRAMIGGKMKFILDSSNRVERIEGWKELVEAMSSKLQGQGRAALGGMLKEDYFRQMAHFGDTLPGRRVSAGECWPSKTDVVMGPMGSVTIELTYTFKGWDRRDDKRMALLESSGTITGNGEQGAGPMGMSMTIDNGKMSGKSWFDPERGQVVESVYDQDMTMRMTVPSRPSPGGPSPGADRSITNRITQRINVKLQPAGA